MVTLSLLSDVAGPVIVPKLLYNADADLLSVSFFYLKNNLALFYEEKDHLTIEQAVLLIWGIW